MEIAAEVSTLKYCFENFLEDKQSTPNASNDGNLIEKKPTNPSNDNITSSFSENNYNQIGVNTILGAYHFLNLIHFLQYFYVTKHFK